MNKNPPISSVGEFGLIEKIKKTINLGPNTHLGPGDDCAVIIPKNQQYLVSTDSLVEGIHFDNSFMSLEHIGYKAVISNVSDIYAMNGDPMHITVSLGISNKYSVKDIENLYSGIQLGCKKHGVDVIGGDISGSFSGLVINITVIGSQKKEKIVYRSGAENGDLIVVSGSLGSAYLGLQILLREQGVLEGTQKNKTITRDVKNQLKKNKLLIEKQIKPEARRGVVQFFRDNDIRPTSMIDVSDGLSSDLLHITKASNVSATVFENKIPITKEALNFCEKHSLNPTVVALSGGEDYELLFTIKPSQVDKLTALSDISIIGKIGPPNKENRLILSDGGAVDFKKIGWDHFSANK